MASTDDLFTIPQVIRILNNSIPAGYAKRFEEQILHDHLSPLYSNSSSDLTHETTVDEETTIDEKTIEKLFGSNEQDQPHLVDMPSHAFPDDALETMLSECLEVTKHSILGQGRSTDELRGTGETKKPPMLLCPNSIPPYFLNPPEWGHVLQVYHPTHCRFSLGALNFQITPTSFCRVPLRGALFYILYPPTRNNIEAACDMLEKKNLGGLDKFGEGVYHVQYQDEWFAVPSQVICFTIALQDGVFLQRDARLVHDVVKSFSLVEMYEKDIERLPKEDRIPRLAQFVKKMNNELVMLLNVPCCAEVDAEMNKFFDWWHGNAKEYFRIVKKTQDESLERQVVGIWLGYGWKRWAEFKSNCCPLCEAQVYPEYEEMFRVKLTNHFRKEHWSSESSEQIH